VNEVVHQVERCDRLLGDHLAAALQTFGPEALGVIDLPPLVESGRLAAPQLRAAATLFWTMQVEGAGLPAFADALAEAVWQGRMALPIVGGAADRLMEYRRDRDERFSVEERRAIYDHLFGPDTGFPVQWRELVEALQALGAAPLDQGTGALTARVAAVALALGQALSDRAVGVTGFAGREIVAHVRAALDLLRDPELARALGGGGVWQILRLQAPSLLGRAVDPTPHLDRAQSGLTILEWIAARAAMLESGAVGIGRDDPVVQAAQRWRAAGGVAGLTDGGASEAAA
jgi:hypothetical protein